MAETSYTSIRIELYPIRIEVHHPLPVELRIRVMDYTVMVRAYNHLVVGIIVQAVHIVVDVMCLSDMRTVLLANYLPANLAAIAV